MAQPLMKPVGDTASDARLAVTGANSAGELQHGASSQSPHWNSTGNGIKPPIEARFLQVKEKRQRMRQFPAVEWHLIPGNHDPHIANSPWERLLRTQLPPNIFIHTTPEPKPIGDGSAWVLPAILNHRHMSFDPTAGFDKAVTPTGAMRIGLAHGSVRSFGSSESSTNNVLAIDRAATAHLDYLALGDWHGMTRIDDRTWYSGTPEPDRFEVTTGQVLLVDVSPNTVPIVTPLESSRFFWHMEAATANSASDVVALESHTPYFSKVINVYTTRGSAIKDQYREQIRRLSHSLWSRGRRLS